MKRRTLTAYILAGVLALGGGAFAGAPYVMPAKPATFDAVVKVIRPNGLGSGVSLPGGVILTAAHVVRGAQTVSLKMSDGKTAPAEVMWVSPEYDIALLHTDAVIPATHLACNEAAVGTEVRAVGAPLGVEFISSYGRIAGKPRQIGPVKSVLVTDITTIMGNSGGPLFDDAGDVVGVVSMIMLVPKAPSDAPTPTGFGFAVPTSVVCKLIGRMA